MAVSFSLAAISLPARSAEALPKRIGECVQTHITGLSHRLDGEADSGSLVVFANGLHQVSYEEEPEIQDARLDDPVSVCLIELPKDCPPGDERGKTYKTTDLRSHKSWTLGDSEHECGGA